MRTGTRCTTLIQLPVAFCAGSSENALPVPAAEAHDLAVVDHLAAVDVGLDGGRLAHADVAQFRFLEVGVDPQLVQRHDRQQRRARRDAAADLHAALRDIARHRCDDRVAARGQPRGQVVGLRGQHVRVFGRRDARHRHARGRQLLLRDVQGGLRIVDGAAGVRHVLAGDEVVGRQRGPARQVFLGVFSSTRRCSTRAS
jgi:hypothetical protein